MTDLPDLAVHIVGSGVAGLSPAVAAADAYGLRVGVLTKGDMEQSNTRWAQGGVAAFACRAVVHPGCKPAVPNDHRNECPMCWSVAMAGTGVLPAATAVALDAPPFSMPAPPRVAHALPEVTTANFQARAPPLA